MTDVPPGWRVIETALTQLYGTQRPRHYGTLVPFRLGGPDPLHGISAYFAREPAPHWHLVSYGLTELFEKESRNPKVSGYGFELTLRLGGAREQEEPPPWVLGLMQSLARYVYSTNRYFEPGHFFELPEPVAPGVGTLAFVNDPSLPLLKGPFGALEFLQIVPLRDDEARALKAWNTVGLVDALGKVNPKWIFTPGRPSALADPAVARAVAEGTARDGSATPKLRLSAKVAWQRGPSGSGFEVTLGAADAKLLGAVLQGRIPFGRPLEVLAAEAESAALRFEPGTALAAPSSGALVMTLTRAVAERLGLSLSKAGGEVRELPGVVFRISAGAR